MRCREFLEEDFEVVSNRILELFLYSVLSSSDNLCVGEKAVYNWMIRLHPKNVLPTRFRGLGKNLKNIGCLKNIWPYML